MIDKVFEENAQQKSTKKLWDAAKIEETTLTLRKSTVKPILQIIFKITVMILVSVVGIMDILLLSDIHQSLGLFRETDNTSQSFYRPLFNFNETDITSGVKYELKSNMYLAYFLIVFIPEVHRWISCLYFISLRQYRQWRYKNIIFLTVIEVIDSLFLGLFVFKAARSISSHQLSLVGFMTVFPISILRLISQPEFSEAATSCFGNQEIPNRNTQGCATSNNTTFCTSNSWQLILTTMAVILQDTIANTYISFIQYVIVCGIRYGMPQRRPVRRIFF